jgi:hypothetical protein
MVSTTYWGTAEFFVSLVFGGFAWELADFVFFRFAEEKKLVLLFCVEHYEDKSLST